MRIIILNRPNLSWPPAHHDVKIRQNNFVRTSSSNAFYQNGKNGNSDWGTNIFGLKGEGYPDKVTTPIRSPNPLSVVVREDLGCGQDGIC